MKGPVMKNDFNTEEFRHLMTRLLKSISFLDKEIELNFGISSTRALTLNALTDKKSLKMNKLSEAMSLTSSTMTRMIDNLIKDKLVERGDDPNDRRVVVVKLTNKGKKLKQGIEEFKNRYFDAVRNRIEDNKEGESFATLKTLIDTFENFKAKV
ncbi:MAG: MarR family transcriptional regulator [Candidatus Scalindua sp.]|nr:MarR family transcriptional regulator [Candidatus Scalindua sp.]